MDGAAPVFAGTASFTTTTTTTTTMSRSSATKAETLATLSPPESFGIVEQGVYRANLPHPLSFPFLKHLNLKTVLMLSQESPTRVVTQFFEDNQVELVQLGMRVFKPTEASWKPCSEELVKEALETVLCRAAHPLLICGASGVHAVGVVVGCLRKLQGWSLSSIVNEYRSYAGTKTRYVDEQFIELFDIDLVQVPADPERVYLPSWYHVYQQFAEEDRQRFRSASARGEITRDGILSHATLSYWKYYFATCTAPLCSSELACDRSDSA
jgi:protein tyrosine/serine phosphatase